MSACQQHNIALTHKSAELTNAFTGLIFLTLLITWPSIIQSAVTPIQPSDEDCKKAQSMIDVQIDKKNWENLDEIVGKIRDSGNCLNNLSFDGALLDGVDLRQANLSNVYFPGAKLTGALLIRAQMQRSNFRGGVLNSADISGGNLSSVQFQEASLRRAKLVNANLDLASLEGADLAKANLRSASLRGADLSNANLTGADLRDADLREARMVGAIITGTKFANAELAGAVFETKGDFKARDFSLAKDIDLLVYENDPNALYQLKDRSKTGGYTNMERQVITALNRNLREHCQPFIDRDQNKDGIFSFINRALEATLCRVKDVVYFIIFDLTVEYGSNPIRALVIFLANLFLFGLFYWLVLRFRLFARFGGIDLVVQIPQSEKLVGPIEPSKAKKLAPEDGDFSNIRFLLQELAGAVRNLSRQNLELLKRSAPRDITRRVHMPYFLGYGNIPVPGRSKLRSEFRILAIALKFSAYRAFHIGVSNLNIGDWIRMVRSQDYELVGRGSIRSIGGWQSLLSTGLLALWLLTMFGKPFDF